MKLFIPLVAIFCLLPVAARAGNSAPDPTYGNAGFESSSSLMVFSTASGTSGGYGVYRLDIKTLAQAPLSALHSAASEIGVPVVKVEPGRDRALVYNPEPLTSSTALPLMFDVDATGNTSFGPNNQIESAGFAADFGPGGQPFALVGYQPFAAPVNFQLLSGPVTAGGVWATLATNGTTGITGCTVALVVDSANNPIGFCDSQLLTLDTGGVLTVGTAQLASPVDTIAGVRAGSQPVFYAALQLSDSIVSIQQGELVAGSWTWNEIQEVTDAPVLQLVAIDASNLAAVILSADGALALSMLSAPAWTVTPVGQIEPTDVVTAWNANELLASSQTMTLFVHGASGWTSTPLGTIGTPGTSSSCKCSMAPEPARAETVALGLFLPLLMILRRRRAKQV